MPPMPAGWAPGWVVVPHSTPRLRHGRQQGPTFPVKGHWAWNWPSERCPCESLREKLIARRRHQSRPQKSLSKLPERSILCQNRDSHAILCPWSRWLCIMMRFARRRSNSIRWAPGVCNRSISQRPCNDLNGIGNQSSQARPCRPNSRAVGRDTSWNQWTLIDPRPATNNKHTSPQRQHFIISIIIMIFIIITINLIAINYPNWSSLLPIIFLEPSSIWIIMMAIETYHAINMYVDWIYKLHVCYHLCMVHHPSLTRIINNNSWINSDLVYQGLAQGRPTTAIHSLTLNCHNTCTLDEYMIMMISNQPTNNNKSNVNHSLKQTNKHANITLPPKCISDT